MSNIIQPQNRFLTTINNSSFVNDGTLNLSINTLKVVGVSANMPIMTDSLKNIISTNTISIPSGTLTIGSAPSTTILQGGASNMLLNDTVLTVSVASGTGPLQITGSDITLNSKSIVSRSYANAIANIGTGSVLPNNNTPTSQALTLGVTSSDIITSGAYSIQLKTAGVYQIMISGNLATTTAGSCSYQITLLQNGIMANGYLNLNSQAVSIYGTQITLTSMINVAANDIFQLSFINSSGSTSSLNINAFNMQFLKVNL